MLGSSISIFLGLRACNLAIFCLFLKHSYDGIFKQLLVTLTVVLLFYDWRHSEPSQDPLDCQNVYLWTMKRIRKFLILPKKLHLVRNISQAHLAEIPKWINNKNSKVKTKKFKCKMQINRQRILHIFLKKRFWTEQGKKNLHLP